MDHGDDSSVLSRQGPSRLEVLDAPGASRASELGVSWGNGFVVDPPHRGPAFPPEVDTTTPLCGRQTFKNLQRNGFAVKWNELRGPFCSVVLVA